MEWQYAMRNKVRLVGEWLQDQWFDRTRRVHTRGDMTQTDAGLLGASAADSEMYQPARPWQVRYALRSLPVKNLSNYTFVDLGSGKGRSLFVAADQPFRTVVGVELSAKLHAQAASNALSYQHRARRCGPITPLHANATAFDFPEGPFVWYVFNPFGETTMRTVLRNLQQSLQQRPRHVLIVLLWPRAGNLVLELEEVHMIGAPKPWLHIFEACKPAAEREPAM